jgi:hypothetical protein
MKNNFRPALITTWVLICLCLLVFAAMIIMSMLDIDWTSDWFYLVFSIPVFIILLLFLLLMYANKGTFEKELQTFDKGTYIAHWIYGEEEWSRFNRGEWVKGRRRAILYPLGVVIILFLIFFIAPDFTMDEIVLVAPWLIGFGVVLIVLILGYIYQSYKRTLDCPREVYIGEGGILYGGYYNSWSIVGSRLAEVKFKQEDVPVLEFVIMVWARYGSRPMPLRIPVPYGREQEAKEIIKIFEKK